MGEDILSLLRKRSWNNAEINMTGEQVGWPGNRKTSNKKVGRTLLLQGLYVRIRAIY